MPLYVCLSPEQVDTVYFKNPRMHEMDDGIGDIQAQITDKQVLNKAHANRSERKRFDRS